MGVSKRTALLTGAILTLGIGSLYLGLTMKTPRPTNDPYSWDLIIFTQTWPNTLCYTWKHENSKHSCYFPKDKNIWTVHGLWPTKLGTIGPGFCNKSIVFNPDSIYGIQDKLNEYWTDIEMAPKNMTENSISSVSHKKDSIWSHEWIKHGSCAMSLPALNTEFKYFYQGIQWSENYNMKNILEKSGINLNSTLVVADYWRAVKSVLKINAWVECVFKSDTKEQMLAEIRICFDKTLKLIDCDGIKKTKWGKSKSVTLTNCDTKKPILYLDYVPEIKNTTNSTVDNKDWDTLKFVQTWPYTFCHALTQDSTTHKCNLPANANQWTIHGIWPTGSFTQDFCKKNTSLNLEALDTIIPELNSHWTDLKGKGNLWEHEWTKHGSCATSLPALDSELKYFKQGLIWSKQYLLNDLLTKGAIIPNGKYPISQIWNTLKTGLGKIPEIRCFVEKDTQKAYVQEVRLCFDKSLSLIDCGSSAINKSTPYTNCPLDQDLYYPGA